jgi:putative ABC transport system substrate-binding protein
MRRREFITLLGTAAAWPLAARAQQRGKVARIGFLRLGSAAANSGRVEALRHGLRQLGYNEGQNIIFEFRWVETVEQLSQAAAELARMDVDIIFALSSTEVEPVWQATKTIPIVFGVHADPVGLGHAASLARPGGNVTGLTVILTDVVVKQLEILKEAVPQATRIGVLFSPSAPSYRPAIQALEVAGAKLRVHFIMAPLRTSQDFDGAFALMKREQVGGFVVLAASFTVEHRERLAELALERRLPGIFGARENVDVGGLMSYSANQNDMVRRAATYIGKILKGATPAELPIEQASKFELVINLKTAKALGLDIPPSLLARADEVIE